MKLIVASVALGIATLAAPEAHAQTTTAMNAKVPFEFALGDHRMPAGDYEVTVDLAMGTLRFRSKQSSDDAVALSTAGPTREDASRRGTLTFRRYGADHFLSGVWFPGRPDGRVVAKSNAEKRLARRWGSGERIEITPQAR